MFVRKNLVVEGLVQKINCSCAWIFFYFSAFFFTVMTAVAAEQFASGTFTESQFESGAIIYAELCASCHGLEAEGGVAVALTGPNFRRDYSSRDSDVGSLLRVISDTMPPRQPDRLTDAGNLAVLAFVLGSNGVLTGSEALKNEASYLSAIRLARGDQKLDISKTFIEGIGGLVPSGSGPSFNDLLKADKNSADWLYHNHNYRGTRYSALSEINRSNITDLVQVCAYQMGSKNTMQTGPIVSDGVMYVTNMTHTAAIDAATCKRIWSYDWEARDRTVWGNNRGVAIKDGYVVRGTNDGYLLALDSSDGKLLWARQVADPWLGETFTMPPMIYKDLILIGPAGSENAISGWVGAFSLSDGGLVWKFETVPEAAAGGGPTWGNPENIPLGGGAVWTPLSLDYEMGELYVAVSNPAPDLPAYLRPGENLYTNNIVALNPENGELVWHKSLVPNDDHDWDLTQVSPVLKSAFDNTEKNLVATVGKDGVLRAIDLESKTTMYETEITTRLNADVPVTREGVIACPGVFGGVLWNGPAYVPSERLLVTPAIDYCARFSAAAVIEHTPGRLYMGGDVAPMENQSGWLTAVGAESGESRWKYHSPAPMVSGVTTTAGGLVVAGELTGNLLFLDSSTGEVLRQIDTGAPLGGGVVSYSSMGRQYIAVSSGNAMMTFKTGHETPREGSIIVYSLPR
jgi:alcohol dehydrogenase (cytochrome c)